MVESDEDIDERVGIEDRDDGEEELLFVCEMVSGAAEEDPWDCAGWIGCLVWTLRRCLSLALCVGNPLANNLLDSCS